MRKFRFKFDTLLKQRKAREESALQQLAAAQRAYHEELSRKNALEQNLSDSLARREFLGNSPVSITAFQTEQDYITGTKQRLIQQQQAITRSMRGVEKSLRTYLSCRKQLSMMETLYEKHYAEFKKELARREAKQMEDFAVMRSRLARDAEEEEIA